jgi:hypothetical protein
MDTEFADAQLKHLVLARQVLSLGLVEGALIATGRRAGQHVVVIVHASLPGDGAQCGGASVTATA